MTKRLWWLLYILIFLVTALAFLYVSMQAKTPKDNALSGAGITSSSSTAFAPSNILPLSSYAKIHVQLPSGSIFPTYNSTYSREFSATSSAGVITFVPNSTESGSGGITSDVYINGQENTEKVTTTDLSYVGFSPDGIYFADRSVDSYGASNFGVGIDIFNLQTGKFYFIEHPPTESASEYVSDQVSWYEVQPFIKSYVWSDNHTINFVFFYVAYRGDVRVSPEELWQYDLLTDKYTLLKTLSE